LPKNNNALRLYPLPPQKMGAHRIYKDLELPPAGRRDASRPYVLINMVSSLDGMTTVHGKAARIGSETDRQVMRTLRSKADAVMIGANTLRAERLSLGLDEPAESQPVAIVLTNTGALPMESHLIRHERQRVLVLVPENLPENTVSRLRRHADVLRVPTTPRGPIDLEGALEILKAEHAVDLLLVEGGPTLNHALISRNLANEFFLTLAPKLLGGTSGEAQTILSGPAPRVVSLLSAYLAGDELFLRYDGLIQNPA
jgi:2,5-diamino-6-(ribosylamino)-4(3H)-pyrimidinone 5'-phosphate reductase